jgi:putative membrane protein
MSDDQTGKPDHRFDVRVTAESHFAWLRTRLALERTMMAYMRTAVSLISFGFGLFQFFYKFQKSPEIGSLQFPDAAWYMGLGLIFCGVMASVFSVLTYRFMSNYLWSDDFVAVAGLGPARQRKHTPLYSISFVIILVGVFAFLSVLLRLL